jgi:hypothetical protein
VPCRKALDAADPTAVNCAVTGRKLTLQTLAILKKIREVDAALATMDRPRVREIHPEVCFWGLNGKRAMRHEKRSRAGIEEREAVLGGLYPGTQQVVQTLLANYYRRDLGHDDILDALVAAVTARRPLCTLPENPPRDGKGLPMEIVYAAEQQVVSMPTHAKPLKIAILGWGSLVWDPRGLPHRPPWALNGPPLPLEFSRVSKDGRLTLVIDPANGERLPTRFALSPRAVLEDAVSDLRGREDTTWRNIGYVHPRDGERARHADVAHGIADWARANAVDAAVWTDLQPNFEHQLGEAFSVERALAYLQRLPKGVAERAQEYIAKAPPEVMTPLRRRLGEIGWKAVVEPEKTP